MASKKMSHWKGMQFYRVPMTWRTDVRKLVSRLVRANETGAAAVTAEKIAVKKVDNLVKAIEFFFKNNDVTPEAHTYGPFDVADGAALILLNRRDALKLSTRLFGARITDLMFDREDPVAGRINLDWMTHHQAYPNG